MGGVPVAGDGLQPEERHGGTLERAGKNRAELEKVLEHYAGDELKYKAACYLIEHMENCYFYADPRIDSLKSLRWMATVYREARGWIR